MVGCGSDERRLDVSGSFEVCEACGYAGGFHALLERLDADGKVKVRLKCPSCGQVYDVGLVARLEPVPPE